MAETQGTYSESWYRVADRHAALRPHLEANRQLYRGELWHVIQDPTNNQFFRLRPSAYDFVARLRLDRTIEQAWQEHRQANPDDAAGQEDVIRLLAQLYSANLLHSDMVADSARLFERYRQRREREFKSRVLGIMFARIPLFDPDELLRRCEPVAKLVLSPVGALVWLAVLFAGGKVALDHAAELTQAGQNVLAPGNLLLLYTGFVVIKAIHEFGHAFMCRRFGGEVHTMGIMFMIFTPMPYVDVTSSWAFRSRWQRILVGAGGMIPELFVAALMMFVWANTGEGTLHRLAYNIMFVASVSTVLFNANPLMRYDGYYIFSDLINIPNLYTRAIQQLGFLFEKYAFGAAKSESPAHNPREAWWLTFYGIASPIYRTWVFAVILFFLAGRYLLLGVIMTAVCAISWFVVPQIRLLRYLASSPRLERSRGRAIAVCAGTLAVALLLLGLVPFPNHFRAPGIVEAAEYSVVANQASGFIAEVVVAPGAIVSGGQVLLRLQDPKLEFELAAARSEMAEARALELRAMQRESIDLRPIRSRIEAIRKRLRRLDEIQQQLMVRARHDGRWVAPALREISGAWVLRGTPIGYVINEKEYYLSAVVPQAEASRLFEGQVQSAEVRLFGQADIALPVVAQKIIPANHDILPSAALGWRGGGELEVKTSDPSGRHAVEPFFESRATILPQPGAAILHGRAGKIRFTLRPEPLLQQWFRKLRQLLQKRYEL